MSFFLAFPSPTSDNPMHQLTKSDTGANALVAKVVEPTRDFSEDEADGIVEEEKAIKFRVHYGT